MEFVGLGPTAATPAVEMIVVPAAETLPLPLGVDESFAFDNGLEREGWVLLQLDRQVVALHDGDLLRPRRLPDAWQVWPADDQRLAVLRTVAEPDMYSVVDRDGYVVGQAPDLITWHDLLRWDGARHGLPVAGNVIAVLANRHVVLRDGSRMQVYDAHAASASAAVEIPELGAEDAWWSGPEYGAQMRAAAWTAWNTPHVLTVTVDVAPQVFDVGFAPQYALVWIDETRLLVTGERRHCVIDVRSRALSQLDGLPRNATPRLNVTGRFDSDVLRAALEPPWRGTISDGVRAELVERARKRLGARADEAEPAIRLRSCLAPRSVAVGVSRFGGRPDIPKGRRWPQRGDKPLVFLAQLRLDDLAAALPERSLPRDGLLLLFAELELESDAPTDLHVEVVATDNLRRAAWPASLHEMLRLNHSLAIAEPTLTLVGDTAGVSAGPVHQMFGLPSTIQDTQVPDGYELLLQLDSDPLVGTSFGDGGRLLIWMPSGAQLVGVIDGCTAELDSDY